MEKEQKSPYESHVFVCTNDRGGVRKSCADPVNFEGLYQQAVAQGQNPAAEDSEAATH